VGVDAGIDGAKWIKIFIKDDLNLILRCIPEGSDIVYLSTSIAYSISQQSTDTIHSGTDHFSCGI
jgi:hypothetical protein